jgi:dUTP pyrophosphatase
MLKVKIKKLYLEVKLPAYAHFGDAGMDLYSLEDKVLEPGERHLFFLGFALEFPDGFVALVKDKGGPPTKFGLHTMGGVFDSSYRGEYNVVLIDLGQEPYRVEKGDKIAQLIILPCECAELTEVDELSQISRGKGRHGSSGIK